MTAIQDAIDSLDAAQTQAFSVAGHAVVLAPPGSGKTKLLVTRMASDLESTISAPRGAACITLTNDAASELHQRFGSLSTDTRSNLFIGTVHAFALTRIVRPFAIAMGQPWLATARIVKGGQDTEFWQSALEEIQVPSGEQSLLFSTVDRFRKLMPPESTWRGLGTYPLAMRDAYLANMDAAEVMDFARVIEHAVSFVENSEGVRAALRASFASIYVDEYQDLAPGLDRVVRALAFGEEAGTSTLFAVGDVDQAIYSWTGTNPKLLRDLSSTPQVTTSILETNYRSGASIVEASRRLFPGTAVPGSVRDGGEIQVVRVDGSIPGQGDWIAARATQLQHGGTALEEVGVLCRTNEIGRTIATRLIDAGVPAWFRPSEDWETPTSILLERACAWICHGREASGQNIVAIQGELKRSLPGLSAAASGALLSMAGDARPESVALDFISALVDALLVGATEAGIEYVTEELDGFLEALDVGALSGISLSDLGARRVTAGKVYVTTLTSSKGLEFDHVFVVDLEEGRIPFFTSFDNPSQLIEERNKFYVAFTRARLTVTLLWSGYTIDRFGRTRDNEISRFVQELALEA